MDNVKDTAIELIRNLKPTDTLSIVAFSDYAEVLLPAGKRVDRDIIETSIRLLGSDGGTEIFRGLEAGLNEVRRNIRASSINHIILLTDGHTYGDEQACLNLADNAAELGIGISGLGIGNEWNDAFLDDLATRTGGNSTYISESTDINRFLKQKFRYLSQAYAEHVVFNLKIYPEVELNYAFRLKPESGILRKEPPLRLGSLPKDSNLEFLIEFLVAPVSPDADQCWLAEGGFSLDIPSKTLPTATIRLALNLPISDAPELQNPPDEILRAMKQLTLYRIQEKARQDIADGDLASANRRLQHLATNLLSQGDHDLARTVLEEAKNLERNQRISEAGAKQIKYGTRALVPPSDSLEEP